MLTFSCRETRVTSFLASKYYRGSLDILQALNVTWKSTSKWPLHIKLIPVFKKPRSRLPRFSHFQPPSVANHFGIMISRHYGYLTATGKLLRWNNCGSLTELTPLFSYPFWVTEFGSPFHHSKAKLGEEPGTCLGLQSSIGGRCGAASDALESLFQKLTNFEAKKKGVSERSLLELRDAPSPSSE